MSLHPVFCVVSFEPCACARAQWTADGVDFLSQAYARSYVRFASACDYRGSLWLEQHIECELAALLAARAPHAFHALAARRRFRAHVLSAVPRNVSEVAHTMQVRAAVAPLCARGAAADVVLGLAGARWPYLVVRLIIDYAVDDANLLREFVRDRIAILALERQQR